MINGRAVMVMEGEVLVPVVVSRLMVVVRVVQREEPRKVQAFRRCLVLEVVRDEHRYLQQVWTDQEALDPEDGHQIPYTALHGVKDRQ